MATVAVADERLGAHTSAAEEIEVSVVMPCLNEADTIAACIEKALKSLARANISGEVIVADNGSADGSPQIACAAGARVVRVAERGYGAALMGGIRSARGKYVVMGDADDSYDFGELDKFVVRLREGYDLVQGCRLPAGGGTVTPGAMPVLHRWLGNPVLTWLARLWFGAPIHDVYCGMRGFSRALYLRLQQRCTGMEFATEMVIKASLRGERISEVPIVLHRDGRRAHPPHLRTWRDGWRTLRFFLMYSPRWLFLFPGTLAIAVGLIGYAIALPGATWHGVTFDAHTLLFASLSVMLGYQAIAFAVFANAFAIAESLMPEDPRMLWLFKRVNLERGLFVGVLAAGAGGCLLALAVLQWRDAEFGPLDYAHTMRFVIPGATLAALGTQTVLSSFFVSILGMKRH